MREEGIKGLYRGLSASLVGLSESTFQFVMYEYFKRLAVEVKQKQTPLAENSMPDVCLSILLLTRLVGNDHDFIFG